MHQAIEQQKDFGLLSIRASAEGTVDKLYLTHTMDRLIDHSISVTGTSLTSSTTSVGEIVLIEDNDNFIRREHPFGLPDYPFGTTWRPGAPGIYYIHAVARDKISQNLILSAPIKITSTSSTGFLPEITMNKVATNMVYTGPTSVSLQATATDRDGHIQQVAFYENGRLIDTVVASPYSTSMDINASGMYEVYAVASDDDGNDITTVVQRIKVNEVEDLLAPLTVSPVSTFAGGTVNLTANYRATGYLLFHYDRPCLCKWSIRWGGRTITIHTSRIRRGRPRTRLYL